MVSDLAGVPTNDSAVSWVELTSEMGSNFFLSP
jgi:hypothetical protein